MAEKKNSGNVVGRADPSKRTAKAGARPFVGFEANKNLRANLDGDREGRDQPNSFGFCV